MSETGRKLEVANKDEPSKPGRSYVDPGKSDRGGLGGFFETVLRRFKDLVHLMLITPLIAVGCVILGAALAPAIALFEFLTLFSQAWVSPARYFMMGFAAAAGFFAYGFSLMIVVPFANWVLRAKLKPWRGPYYSLETIRWYIHNGATYLVRYSFLEFITPSPFSIYFYKAMGMKIGRGVALNTTHISDPSMIELGDKSTIGGSATIVAHYGQGGYLVLAPVKIGARATVGLKATIMGGVTIGEDAKVLANSFVLPKTQIPPGETWGGVPAKKLDS